MTLVAESMLKELLELPEDERSAIADLLYESLWNNSLNAKDTAGWQAFLDERIAEADRGEFAEGPADDVSENIRRELAEEAQ